MADAETEPVANTHTASAPTKWFSTDGGKVLIVVVGAVVILLLLLGIGSLAGFEIPPPAPEAPATPASSTTSAP
ncbi:hypothetical protein, partial [Mycolicibacterium mucogenicum]|uniref:hypothetical protein n=2 Tax=Mycolicibacterium mucogenicum TaxID=56689 RepID=UPI0019505A63